MVQTRKITQISNLWENSYQSLLFAKEEDDEQRVSYFKALYLLTENFLAYAREYKDLPISAIIGKTIVTCLSLPNIDDDLQFALALRTFLYHLGYCSIRR